MPDTAALTRYEIVAPQNGAMVVALGNLRRSDAAEMISSFGGQAFIRIAARSAA